LLLDYSHQRESERERFNKGKEEERITRREKEEIAFCFLGGGIGMIADSPAM
jgi:hypothetical protein